MESFSEDVVFLLCSFLEPRDLARLALTCTYLGGRPHSTDVGTASVDATASRNKRRKTSHRRNNAPVKSGGNAWSLVEEAARRRVDGSRREEWGDVLARRGGESWTSVDHRAFRLGRASLAFDQLVGSGLEFVNNDVSRVRAREFGTVRATAICGRVMRGGKHFAVFTATFPGEHGGRCHRPLKVGVMRPVVGWPRRKLQKFDPTHYDRRAKYSDIPRGRFWPRETKQYFEYCARQYGEEDENNDDTHCCFYDVTTGTYENGYKPGHSPFFEVQDICEDDRLGLLLDLDEGSMAVYKNERRLGILRMRLSGEYCWAVTVANKPINGVYEHGDGRRYWEESAVSIEGAPVPSH